MIWLIASIIRLIVFLHCSDELIRNWSFKLHWLMSHRMIEAEHISMQAKTAAWVITVSVLDVATDRMAHICCMYTNLVLSTRLQLIFYQGMLGSALQCMKVGYCIFAAIVCFAGISNICLVVLQPVGNGSLVFLHLSGNQGNVSAVVYVVVPVILQRKLGLLVLGVNHQSRSVTVKTVNYVSLTVLAGLVEVIIQYGLYVERRMSGSHTEDAHVLFNHDDVAVFINNLDVSALENLLVLLGLAYAHLHARFQSIVELGDGLAIHLDSSTLQRLLHLGLAGTLYVLHQPLQQLRRLLHLVVVIFIRIAIAVSIVGMLIKIAFIILLFHFQFAVSCYLYLFVLNTYSTVLGYR